VASLGFRHRPLRYKLAALLGLCAAMTAVFVSGTVFAISWWSMNEHARADAVEATQSLTFALRAPLAFEDTQGLRDALDMLRARPHVQGAWVYDRAGVLAMSWGRAPLIPLQPLSGGLLAGHVAVRSPIEALDGGQPFGTVSLYVDLSEQRRMLAWQALTAALAGLFGVLLSVWVSGRLSRRVSAPILDLAETASAIASGRTYDRRLRAAGDDEVGRAVTAFNAMIDEVERRGDALVEANRALEYQVEIRTLSMQRAEAASVAKTRFLSNMSHELRSPLNGVIGAAQLLQEGHVQGAQRDDLVNIIRTSGSNLLGLIDSILDLARIEAGAMELDVGEFDLVECVDAAVATSAVPARAKGLQMAVVIEPSVVARRRGDALRLRQVLLNLLGNAVKFTLQGEVVVRVRPGTAPGELVFDVSDTGIGMDASAVDAVFEPFRQADESTTRRFGGSGLGLAICRQVVQLMGGAITLASRPDQGSCFSVAVPLPEVPGEPAVPPRRAGAVAYWEPHGASAEALGAVLTRLGYASTRCDTVDDALAFAAGGQGWLLVATDAPGGAALVIAAEPRLGMGRVIAITGADAVRHPRHWHASAAKPVLQTSVATRLGGRALPAQASIPLAPSPMAARPDTCQVLVVEDEPVNQTIVGSMLTSAGFSVVVASDGAAALACFAHAHFDLVLMDWQMPDMDGLEVTRRLRAGASGEHGTHVPILALTANAFAEDRAACMAAGMNDFLTKPVLAADLVNAALRWTRAAHRAPR
jgi:two-component system sensor histidine kinase BarA